MSRSCQPHALYDMRSTKKAVESSYIGVKKVLLRRDVITAPFIVKLEAGQESVRNKGDQHQQRTQR